MKLSSSTLCGCCFCCYCHCWLMMLLMLSSAVLVSPEITTPTTNKKFTKLYNNNYAYQSEMTEFVLLNRKMPNSRTTRTVEKALTLSMLPKLSPTSLPQQLQPKTSTTTRTSTNTHYKQNNVNSYQRLEYEAITIVATTQTKSKRNTKIVASESKQMSSIPAPKQLQITKQSNRYDTTIAAAAVDSAAKTKSREKRQLEEEGEEENGEGSLYEINESVEEKAATSRTTTAHNYVADKSNVFMPSTMLRIEPTTKPFVQAVTIEKTKTPTPTSTSDYGSSNKSDKNVVKTTKYWNVTIDLNPIVRQQHNDSTNNSSSSNSGNTSKTTSSESSNDITNFSNNGNNKNNNKTHKTTNTFSLNQNNRYGTINNKKTTKSSSQTTTKSLKQKEKNYRKTKIANKRKTTTARIALDATETETATAINSLPPSGPTGFSRKRRHNFKNRNGNSYNYNYNYNYNANTTANNVSNLNSKEINQYSYDNDYSYYHQQKRTSISDTTSSLSLQLRTPATFLAVHQQEEQNNNNNHMRGPALLHRHGRQAVAEEKQSEKCRMFLEGDSEKNELYSPEYPNDYPKNINCTRVITAPKGQIIRLDFRNSFNIEEKEECKFDFLEYHLR